MKCTMAPDSARRILNAKIESAVFARSRFERRRRPGVTNR